MKKQIRLLALFAAAVLLLNACGDAGSPPTEASVPTAESAATETQPQSRQLADPPTDYVTAGQMALADPWSGSDESAIAAVMRRAEAGEPVTVAVIGGSITQGTISNGTSDRTVKEKKSYADIFRDWWEETFPETEITFVNAGIGATDSYLGVHRVEKDVLSFDPDLVLVEFSVNDSSSASHKTSYDNLLRTMLLRDDPPAVLLLFMGQTNGSSAQDIHSLVGFQYALPMVSYLNVIRDMMDSGSYTADALSGDVVHPSALGHRITGEILWKYLNSIYENADAYAQPEKFTKPAFTKDKYVTAPQILDRATLAPTDPGVFRESSIYTHFPNSWTTTEGGQITFEITCRNLGILYYCQTDGNGGQFEVLVDGEVVAVLDADFTGGWGNYAQAQECYASDSAAAHTVVIRKSQDSTGDAFTVLGLLISQ